MLLLALPNHIDFKSETIYQHIPSMTNRAWSLRCGVMVASIYF